VSANPRVNLPDGGVGPSGSKAVAALEDACIDQHSTSRFVSPTRGQLTPGDWRRSTSIGVGRELVQEDDDC